MRARSPRALRLASIVASVAVLGSAPVSAQDAAPPAEAPAPAPAPPAPAPPADAPPADAPPAGTPDAGTPAPKKRKKKPDAAADAGPGATDPAPSAPKSDPPKSDPPKSDPPKSAPKPPAAPKEPEKPAVPPEVLEKAKKLASDLRDALIAEPGNAKELEQLTSITPPDPVLAAEPTLKALLKIARARQLLLQNRLEDAHTTANEARGIVDAVSGRSQRALVAQLRYRQAEIEEAKSKQTLVSCGPLGLKKLAALEGKQARARVETVAARYKHAVNAGERFWSRRAAFRTAVLYDELYRKALQKPATYRGAPLPSPISVGKVDTATVLASVLGGAWPAEISRLYSEVIASIDAREPDPTLLAQVRERAADFARLSQPEGEIAENPWLADEKPGLVRHHRQWQKKQADGSWASVPAAEGEKAAQAMLTAPVASIERAYALYSLADAGKPAPPAVVVEGLVHAEPRVKLFAMLAAERKPDVVFLEPLLSAYLDAKEKGPAFSTLQGALFGQRERALLALRALANADRPTAEKILAEKRLPPRERAWIVAEVGERSLQYGFQSLLWDGDAQAGATALYGLINAVGKNGAGYLRTGDDGPVGCVSKALQDTLK